MARSWKSLDLPFFENLPVPVILVDTPAHGHSLNCVTMNNEEIAEKAVDYFYRLGHRKIGYLHSSMNTGNFRARMQGYLNALNRLGLEQPENGIYELTPSMAGSYKEMSKLLEDGTELPPALLAVQRYDRAGLGSRLEGPGMPAS